MQFSVKIHLHCYTFGCESGDMDGCKAAAAVAIVIFYHMSEKRHQSCWARKWVLRRIKLDHEGIEDMDYKLLD